MNKERLDELRDLWELADMYTSREGAYRHLSNALEECLNEIEQLREALESIALPILDPENATKESLLETMNNDSKIAQDALDGK